MLKGILVTQFGANVAELSGKLEGYYKALECDTIDIVSRNIGGEYYDIVCDDEGLFKENFVSMICEVTLEPMLVGNLFICRHNRRGNEVSLTADDVTNILAHCVRGPHGFVVKGGY